MVLHASSILLLIGSMLWVDVPFVSQSDQGCGAAGIAMVMKYWSAKGHPFDIAAMDETKIMRMLYSKEVDGIRASDMQKYLEEQGFQVFAFSGTPLDLQQHIQKGRPLIAALSVKNRPRKLHYVVVTGVNLQDGFILVNDPARRKLAKISRSEFEERWKATDNWTLLAVPVP